MAARGVNKVILVGNLGSDPEVRYMPNGGAVANVSIATSESWKDKNTGQTQERTEWHRVVFYQRLAEIVGEYVRKGSKIYVEGRLQTRQWEKDGVKHYTTEIIAGELQMLDSRPSGGDSSSEMGSQAATPPQNNHQGRPATDYRAKAPKPAPPPSAYAEESFNDEIPF